jgi:hypothetical protein
MKEQTSAIKSEENRFIEGNIPLVINSYVDIFSSFDSRPLAEKALSVDFLSEVKRAAREKNDLGLELIISVPKEKRNLNDEFIIRKRLKEHFHKHFLEKEGEIRAIRKRGLKWIGFGILFLITVLLALLKFEGTIWSLVLPLLEVPSWFLIWEGMGKLFLESGKTEPDYLFYKKMSNVQITFKNY